MDFKQIIGIILNAFTIVPEGVKNSFLAFLDMLKKLFK